MSYANIICVPGYRLHNPFETITPLSIWRETLFVPGRHWAFREAGVLRHWYSPELDWFAEFRAECDYFEREGRGWTASRDGFEYYIPERWNERTICDEWWSV